MIRHSLKILVVAAMGIGALAVDEPAVPANASATQFTNIGVQVNNGTATYYLCFSSPVGPDVGGVVISGPDGQHREDLAYNNQTCTNAGRSYQVTATFPNLASGQYTFVDAVMQGTDGNLAGLTPGYAFMGNGNGLTVGTACAVNFSVSPDGPGNLQGCDPNSGAYGGFNGPQAAPPTNTPTATPTATATATTIPPTATPTATNTSVVNNPKPSPTKPSGGGNGGGGSTVVAGPPSGGGNGGGGSTVVAGPPNGGGTGGGGNGGGGGSIVIAGPPQATSTDAPFSVVISSGTNSSAQKPPGSATVTPGSGVDRGASSGDAATSTPGAGADNGKSGTGAGQGSSSGVTAGSGHVASTAPKSTPTSQPTGHSPQKTAVALPSTSTHTHARTTATPLYVSLQPFTVQPGGTERIVVSYNPQALVQATVTFPGQAPLLLSGQTNSHGMLTLAVRVPVKVQLYQGNARAVVRVQAVSGPWAALAARTLRTRPNTVKRVVISAPRGAVIHIVTTFPGTSPLSSFGTADRTGRYVLTVRVPAKASVRNGTEIVRLAVSTLAVKQHATKSAVLAVSDFIVNISGSAIVKCAQTQNVHIVYHPNTPVRVLVLVGNGLQFTLAARTNASGEAMVPINMSYVQALSPVQVSIAAVDASSGAHRMAQALLTVSLPHACQLPADGSVTVGP